ncbi:MAG: murein biosynthesis integral membrane protein MurJ, partial [Patescibacteria group bacterium]
MKNISKYIEKIVLSQQSTVFTSTLIISVMVIVARIFGFLRYRIFAGYFTKEQLDLFFAAFRIPDLIFEILITGALTTSLIPFFIKYQNNKEAQNANMSTIINIVMLALLGVILVLLILLHPIISLITPGFSAEKIDIITRFSYILLIGQLPFFVLGTFLTGISQSKKAFLIPAIAPIVYNIAIIIITFLFAKSLYLYAPIFGVVVGALLFFVVQLPVLYFAHFEYKFVLNKTPAVAEFFKVSLPRILTSIVGQIDATIDLSLTSLLGSGSYTVFYLAQHLHLLPVAVLGISFGQASLPYLSEIYNKEDNTKFKEMIVDSILNVFFLTVPIMGFFIVTRTPIVRFFFGGEKFDWPATVATAVTLSVFSLAIPFHSVYYFLTRCFYAFFDSKTPFVISLISIFLNASISLILILVFHMPVWSLAFSFTISMAVSVTLLIIMLYKKLGG